MTTIPVHPACQDYDIQSQWKIVHKHPLVSYWKDIVRVGSFVHGACCIDFRLATEADDGLVPMDLSERELDKLSKQSDICHELGTNVKFMFSKGVMGRRNREMDLDTVADHFRRDISQGLFLGANLRLIFRGLSLHAVGQAETAVPSNHEGTLLLEIRSPHTGGSMPFNVDGETVDWDISEDNNDGYVRWCAFRSNVSFEMQPVTSGVLALMQFDISIHESAQVGQKRPREEEEEEEVKEDEGSSSSSDEEDDGNEVEDFFYQATSFLSSNHTVLACECQEFLTALSEYTSRRSIALPLFHSYDRYAYLRPAFLKPADRILFDELLKAGYHVLLTPVMIHNEIDEDGISSPTLGPCDPYDRVYSAAKIRDEHGHVAVISSAADCADLSVRYIHTNNLQATNYYHMQRDDGEGISGELKYYSAALVILQKSKPTETMPEVKLFDASSADITLVVQGERLPAHKKEVLCAHSPVFQAMFQNAMKEAVTNEVVVSEEFSVDAIQAMLHFLYADSIPLSVLKTELLQLLSLAVYYQMPKLKEYVEDACKALINVNNVHEILLAVYHHGDECAAFLDYTLCWVADNANVLIAENPEFVCSLRGELLARTLIGLAGVSNQKPRSVKNY